MLSGLLERLERRFGRHRGVRNLMNIIVIGTAIVFLADYILPLVINGRTLSSWISFRLDKIRVGEIWRLITFVFVPTGSANLIFLVFSLYFSWLMGTMLQNHWGTLRFTVFYAAGILGAVVSGLITGYATAYYLNLSLMLAMACIRPDMEVNLYGILRFRLKWLALLSVLSMALPMLQAHSWAEPAALIAALINVIVFFADKMMAQLRQAWRHYQWKRNWRSGWKR